MPPEGTGPMPDSELVDELLRRLRWTVLGRIATHPGGDERSPIRGPGVEHWEQREYRPGDDPRLIDWNLSARTGAVYVRQSRPERGLDAWILADVSPSVDWGTARLLKRDLALAFVIVAGRLLERHGNRVGALFFSDRPLGFVPPALGRPHLLRLVAELARARDQAIGPGPTDVGAALAQGSRLMRRRALVIVLTDFLGTDGWDAALVELAARHEVVAVTLCDPREADIPDVGVVTFEDPETGEQLTVDTGDARLRARFRQAAARQEAELARRLGDCGVPELRLSTEADLLPRLVAFFEMRQVQARRRGPAFAGAAGRGSPR